MSLLSRLFGGASGKSATPEAVEYKEFHIYPDPMKEANGYRLAARVEKEIGGDLKSHHLIRADTFQSEDQAIAASTNKAKQLIDQMGDQLF